MRDIKFDIIARNIHFNEIHHEVYTLEQIWDDIEISMWLKSGNCEMIAKRQWTGLNDKQGVPIYEGDILQYKYDNGWRHSRQAVVEWKARKFHVGFTIGKGHREQPDDADVAYEVIGNIYEHPSLIKGRG